MFHENLRVYLTGGDVATTDQSQHLWRLRRPKNGLRSHQGDVLETSPEKVTTRGGASCRVFAWGGGGGGKMSRYCCASPTILCQP